jgi:hypothetical protein
LTARGPPEHSSLHKYSASQDSLKRILLSAFSPTRRYKELTTLNSKVTIYPFLEVERLMELKQKYMLHLSDSEHQQVPFCFADPSLQSRYEAACEPFQSLPGDSQDAPLQYLPPRGTTFGPTVFIRISVSLDKIRKLLPDGLRQLIQQCEDEEWRTEHTTADGGSPYPSFVIKACSSTRGQGVRTVREVDEARTVEAILAIMMDWRVPKQDFDGVRSHHRCSILVDQVMRRMRCHVENVMCRMRPHTLSPI